MNFGQRIRDARIKNNLTQDQVAKKFFITRQTISSWEQEKTYPDIASLIKISDYYHISLDTLLKKDSGIREHLEKREIKRALKPTYTYLIIIYLLLALMLIGVMTGSIKTGLMVYPILFLLFLSCEAMFELYKLDQSTSLGLKYKWQDYISGNIKSKYTIILASLLVICGLTLMHLHYFTIAGFIGGIGSVILVFNLLNHKTNHRHK